MLVEILDVLRIAVEAYRGEHPSAWLIISARLHQLLVDKTNKQLPLALRVIPNLKLHPMNQNLKDRKVDYIMASPVAIHSTEGRVNLEIFDTSKLRIDICDWLEQVAYIIDNNEITVKQLVEETRHQAGGVHFDPELRPSTHRIEGILLFATIGEKQLSFRDYIFAIGEYIQVELNAQLIAALGNGFRQEGEYEKASDFYEAALRSFTEIADIQGQSEQWNNKGYLAYLRGNLAMAKGFYHTAQRINEQLTWDEALINVNNNLAIVCLELGNHYLEITPEYSVDEYLSAFDAGKAINDFTHQSIALANLSDAYFRLGKNLEAITAVLLPLVLMFPLDSNLKARIERKVRYMIDNLSTPFDELLTRIEKEPKVAVSLTLGPRINVIELPDDVFGGIKQQLLLM